MRSTQVLAVALILAAQLALPSAAGAAPTDQPLACDQTADKCFLIDLRGHKLWGLGGNLNLTAVLSELSPILNGGTSNIDVGALLAQLLPLVDKLQAGQVVGVQVPANGDSPTFCLVQIARSIDGTEWRFDLTCQQTETKQKAEALAVGDWPLRFKLPRNLSEP
jgi:hypothetical protein